MNEIEYLKNDRESRDDRAIDPRKQVLTLYISLSSGKVDDKMTASSWTLLMINAIESIRF